MSLSKIITQVRRREGSPEEDWLFITGKVDDINLDTECELGIIDCTDDDEEIIPDGFRERGLRSTIDYQTVEDSIKWADNLSSCEDDSAAAEIIRYYIRFDAWPDRLGAPDPPPANEILARLDREFYDSLGKEREGTTCKIDLCSRGTVQFSPFCASHHFENIKKKPCPY